MDAAKGGAGRVWLDVTTTSHAGARHDGTTRIERGLIRELPALLSERLGFCVYDRTFRHFSAVDRPSLPDVFVATRPAKRRGRGPIGNAGRKVEKAFRGLIKGAAAEVVSTADRFRERRLFPEAGAGDVLLLAGENWGRHDFGILRELKRRQGIRIAAVLQDMVPSVHPQFFDDEHFMARFQDYVDFLANDADVVLVISQCTRNDFLKAAPGADPAKIVQISLGADFKAARERQRPEGLPGLAGKPFVLSVSTIQVRKNFDLLYRLWQKFAIEGGKGEPHLVIVGREGFGSADLMHLMRNDPWIAKTVTVLNRASDAELAWLYANAAFTLYPSWYEGWGLPLSESLAYGKTFIASDTSSLPEAGQGLGIHLSPYDLVAWEREVLRLSNDAEARAAMERRIVAERRLPNWADCARDVARAIGQVTAVAG